MYTVMVAAQRRSHPRVLVMVLLVALTASLCVAVDAAVRPGRAAAGPVTTTPDGAGLARGEIARVAGGLGPPAIDALEVGIEPGAIAARGADIYEADRSDHVVRRRDASGLVTIVAGTGVAGYTGDGGPATAADIDPGQLAVGPAGDIYIGDATHAVVRKVAPDGTITTVAGNGTKGYSGDGGPATQAQLHTASDVAVDAGGALYIADWEFNDDVTDVYNQAIRKVDASGTITTFATSVLAGGLAIAPDGALYAADLFTGLLRFDGVTRTEVGVQAFGPLTVDGAANVYAVVWPATGDPGVERIDPGGGTMIVDTGGPAGTSPSDVAVGDDGLLVAQWAGVYAVPDGVGPGSLVLGNGCCRSSGDGGLAVDAQLEDPTALAVVSGGDVIVGSTYQLRTITPGGAIDAFDPAAPPAGAALVVGESGDVYTSDGRTIWRIAPDHSSTVIAGADDAEPDGGDEGPASAARFTSVSSLAVLPDGSLLVCDFPANRIRRVDPAGVIHAFAGTGTYGWAGDGTAAVGAQLAFPRALAVDSGGRTLIAEYGRLRRVETDGTITTIAGSGYGDGGDGGPASAAMLSSPEGLAVAPSGAIYVADTKNGRVRRIGVDGVITTVAGTGARVNQGDGGWARSASFADPRALAFSAQGDLLVADGFARRVRLIRDPDHLPGPPTNVTAVAGVKQASVSWAAAVAGADPITAYSVRAVPGGAMCTTTGALSCTVPGLAGGTTYSFVVRALTAGPDGPDSLPSNTVTPVSEPAAPFAPQAAAGKQKAQVVWYSPPDGGRAITDYVVTVWPDGLHQHVAPVGPGQQLATVDGLVAGSSYSFSVTAVNDVGASASSAPSNAVTPTSGSLYHPLWPTRVLDSRTSLGGWSAPLAAGSPRSLGISGGAVPAGASAVVANVTVTNPTAASFLTLYPTGTPVPDASNLNFAANQTVANLVTVPVGVGGSISFADAVGATDVVVDVLGWYDDGETSGLGFGSVEPTRVLDSRTPAGGWAGPLSAGASRALTMRGVAGVPTAAVAVVAQVTVTNSTVASFLNVWPEGQAGPDSSTTNFGAGQTVANLVVMPIGNDGAIRFATAAGSVDVVVDVVGFFGWNVRERFHPMAPTRVLDDRVGLGAMGPWQTGQDRDVELSAAPASLPGAATSIVMNLTATNASAGSFVTAHAAGLVPATSTLNFGPNQTVPTLTFTPTGPGPAIGLRNELGTVDLVADLVGWFAPY